MGMFVIDAFREKGDSPRVCDVPSGPYRQMETVRFTQTVI
jgi:hypothetical protein